MAPPAAAAGLALALLALAPSAHAQLVYKINFYKDKACASVGDGAAAGGDWTPGTCYSMIPYGPTTQTASFSIGVKLTEDTPGKQVTINGFLSTTANYAACGGANTLLLGACSACSLCSTASNCGILPGYNGRACCNTVPGGSICSSSSCLNVARYDCNTAYTAGETCNSAVPSCSSGTCSYGAATALPVIDKLPTDTCAMTSDTMCQTYKICSAKITTGLGPGPIVGIVIGALALISLVALGVCFRRKSGPFAPGASFVSYFSCGRLAAQPAKAPAADAPVVQGNVLIRAVGDDEPKAAEGARAQGAAA